MFRNHVVIGDRSDHLNVEFLLSISESWFEYDKIIRVEICLEIESLCKRRHFSSSEIDSSLYFTSTIAKFEHIGVILSMTALKSGNNRYGIKLLSIKGGIIFKLVIDLMDSEWNDSFMIDRFVLFFGRIHC